MHRLVFAAKRFWLGFGRMYMPVMQEEFGLTPARYDFLMIVAPLEDIGIDLREVRRLLGVSRTAVSKMSRLLEDLGFLERTHIDGRKRRLTISLTKAGRKIFRRARHYIRRRSFMQKPLEHCFGFRGKPRAAVGDVIADLEELAFQVDDRAELEYPSIYPDDMRLEWWRHDHDVFSERHPLDSRWERFRRRVPWSASEDPAFLALTAIRQNVARRTSIGGVSRS